jgi:ubiquinol-cytochrome c reductase cytochrome b subunit
MLILVTGENLLIILLGWEGDIIRLKWLNILLKEQYLI